MPTARRLLTVLFIGLGGGEWAFQAALNFTLTGLDAIRISAATVPVCRETPRGVFAMDSLKLPSGLDDVGRRFKREPMVSPKQTLAAAITRGEWFRVTFDRLPRGEALGTIRTGAVLTGFYTESENAWEVWSPSHPQHPNQHFIYSPRGPVGHGFVGIVVRPADGRICLWGGIFPFDKNGSVYHPRQPDVVIGRLELLR